LLVAAAAIVVGAAAASADGSEKTGSTAAQGGAVPYGFVSVDGKLGQSRSKNLGNATVRHHLSGLYCLSGLPFQPKNVSVTVGQTIGGEGTGALNPTQIVELGGLSCPVGTQVAIAMADPSSDTFAHDHDFFFLLH
jgi:hypothetical protein